MDEADLKRLLDANAAETRQHCDSVAVEMAKRMKLVRRVRSLEDGLASLRARVERLESSAH